MDTAKAIYQKDSNWLRSSFNSKTWGSLNKSGLFKVNHNNLKEILLLCMSVKENIFNSRKIRYEMVNRFRNGDITEHLTSVDIEEIVRSG